jgi:membrane protease YdiL (CAAX protease family)
MSKPGGYLAATRHPLPCLLFVLPLLVGYEVAVLLLGGDNPERLRNGADDWFRGHLASLWPPLEWAAPLLLLVALGVWAWLRSGDRPVDLLGVLSGMGIESVAYALGLWVLHRTLVPLLDALGVQLAVGSGAEPSIRDLVPFIGAGVYEEAFFRLVLFSALLWVLLRVETPPWLASLLAAIGSATLFSAAHHFGPNEATWNTYVFLFRVLAGIYFAWLYQWRGFGVVVGAHACYNVMVSVGTL